MAASAATVLSNVVATFVLSLLFLYIYFPFLYFLAFTRPQAFLFATLMNYIHIYNYMHFPVFFLSSSFFHAHESAYYLRAVDFLDNHLWFYINTFHHHAYICTLFNLSYIWVIFICVHLNSEFATFPFRLHQLEKLCVLKH